MGILSRWIAKQLGLVPRYPVDVSGGSLMLENALSWTHLVTTSKRALGKLQLAARMLLDRPAISAAQFQSLPLESLDEVATGERVPFWRDWMEHASAGDPWWAPMNFHRTIPDLKRPISPGASGTSRRCSGPASRRESRSGRGAIPIGPRGPSR